MRIDDEEKLWLLLIGSMLANSKVREESERRIVADDVPEPLRRLYRAVVEPNPVEVGTYLSGLGIKKHSDGAIRSILQALEEACLQRYCAGAMNSVSFAKGVDPERLLDILDSLATNIRARVAKKTVDETKT